MKVPPHARFLPQADLQIGMEDFVSGFRSEKSCAAESPQRPSATAAPRPRAASPDLHVSSKSKRRCRLSAFSTERGVCDRGPASYTAGLAAKRANRPAIAGTTRRLPREFILTPTEECSDQGANRRSLVLDSIYTMAYNWWRCLPGWCMLSPPPSSRRWRDAENKPVSDPSQQDGTSCAGSDGPEIYVTI